MNIVIEQSAFDRGAQSLSRLLTADQWRQLITLPPDRDLETRVEQLARKANEGELDDDERAEYEGYIHANNLLAVLRGIGRRRLAAKNGHS